jgi:hypothetical protein
MRLPRLAIGNLLPDVMDIPVPAHGQKFRWLPIRSVDEQPNCGPVYSLGVDKHHHYMPMESPRTTLLPGRYAMRINDSLSRR